MPSPKTQPARGMRDFLPADVRKREYVIGVIKQVYERYGFEPLETPAVENIETLMGKYGEEGNQLIFKILKRGEHEKTGEADLALRYDLTVPLARVVAQYQNDLPKFFKRYQIQPVWRADRPARGRFREFYQCDVDVLGSRSMVVEAELIAAASDALVALGFEDFVIRVNHRRVLSGLLENFDVPPDKHSDALVALDKLEKIGVEGVTRELADKGLSQTAIDSVLWFPNFVQTQSSIEGTDSWNEIVLEAIALHFQQFDQELAGLDDLRNILKYSQATSALKRIKIDPSLVRGLSYYTGTIIEITVPGLAGSLGGGGRYDNLVGMFLGKDVPACGFSLGLERIIVVMEELKKFEALAKTGQLSLDSADVMVAVLDEDSIPDALVLARELRDARLRVLFYPEVRKMNKQLFYWSNREIRSVIIVGPDQIQSGVFRVKDKRRGEHALSRGQIANTLRAWIDEDAEAYRQRRAEFIALLDRQVR